MKTGLQKTLAIILSLIIVLGIVPAQAFADGEPNEIVMLEGEVISGFAAGKETFSSAPEIAWVDGDGNLNALKEGVATVTVNGDEYSVTVNDYSDGSEVVGQLKILARFNDSMQFYDGHVYLLFTSYQDGVEITVDDLYAGYDISDAYYTDIRKDVSNGSHRTGTDTDRYFTLRYGSNTTVLDRGEIVTIGMYRDFGLSVADAALGCLKNSSAWGKLSDEAKTVAIDTFLEVIESEKIDEAALFDSLFGLAGSAGNLKFEDWLDGKVNGGVCFNRELYNQKLEYDQFENVTYELDITENQLEALIGTLGGNLNNFSILKNSCVTVALRAWNAAVGMRDGERTAYYLEPEGSGVFSLIDAPKTVKTNITERLPGHYLNSSDGVEEPSAGYYDGQAGEWVYVSAPEEMELEAEEPAEEDDKKLTITVSGAPDSYAKIYYFSGEDEIEIHSDEDIPAAGTEIYIIAGDHKTEGRYLDEITLNDELLLPEEDGSYKLTIPEEKAELSIRYSSYTARAKGEQSIQCFVGDTLDIGDYVELYAGDEQIDISDGSAVWFGAEFSEAIEYGNDDHTVLRAACEGDTIAFVKMKDGESAISLFAVHIFPADGSVVPLTWETNGNGTVSLYSNYDGSQSAVSYSGYYVRKGAEITYEAYALDDHLLTEIIVNGVSIAPGEPIVIGEEGVNVEFVFSPVSVYGVPEMIELPSAGDTFRLEPYVLGEDGNKPFADVEYSYESLDGLVEIDEDGMVRIAGEIPKGGKAVPVIVNVKFGNSGLKVYSKVIVGNYDGERIVGKATIATRKFTLSQLLATHAYVSFTPYDYTDLSVNYYRYYKPSEAYLALMRDYANNRDNYPSDPAVISDEIYIENREGYFDILEGGNGPEAVKLSLKPGETVTFTSYPYEESKWQMVSDAVKNGQISSSAAAKMFVDQLEKYLNDEEFDRPELFDSLISTLAEVIMSIYSTGTNPADGLTKGGITLGREFFTQFASTTRYSFCDYFTVEITADELAAMENYLSVESSNSYSLLIGNCVSASRNIWNAAMYDRPELQVKTSRFGLFDDPEVLRQSIFSLNSPDGERGTDYYPRIESHIASFDANGGDGAMEDQYFADSVFAELNRNAFTRRGYTFEGWNTDRSGSGVYYADGEKIAITADLELYAQWSRIINTPPAESITDAGEAGGEKTEDENIIPIPQTQVITVKGKDGETASVTIDLSSLSEDITGVTIPKEKLDDLSGTLIIKLPQSSVTFDAAALAEIRSQTEEDIVLCVRIAAEQSLNAAQKNAVSDIDVQTVYDISLLSGEKRITDFGGGSAAVKVGYELKADQKSEGLEVWYVSDDGSTERIPAAAGSGFITFSVNHFSNYVVAYNADSTALCEKNGACPASAFTDLDLNAWYHDGIHWALKNGIVNGYDNGLFGANDAASRAMVVTMLYRIEGEPAVEGDVRFSDVSDGMWYTDPIKWAVSAGIVRGYGDGTFGVSDDITREQLAAILYRYAKLKGRASGEVWSYKLEFSDADEVSDWAYEAMCWVSMNGVIRGTGNNMLSPKTGADRAQTVTMLRRYFEK
ncbi:MAG: S-layer homology domain-containing protein [Oscillospiraceae bacterium]|nr:S-layer homology domain-containing protein [Oscillospiraceae bacterium]